MFTGTSAVSRKGCTLLLWLTPEYNPKPETPVPWGIKTYTEEFLNKEPHEIESSPRPKEG